jgi:hypothetical protein
MKHQEPFPIDPELEARVVAWVLGEASPFEAAELSRQITEHPELALFKRRIEAVHGLVGEAARPVPAELKLSPERRAKLLATIGMPSEPPSQSGLVVAASPAQHRRWWYLPAWAYSAAATIVLCLIAAAMIPHFGKVRSSYAPGQAVEQPHGFLLKNPDAGEGPSLFDRVFQRKKLREREAALVAILQERRAKEAAMREEAIREEAKRRTADVADHVELSAQNRLQQTLEAGQPPKVAITAPIAEPLLDQMRRDPVPIVAGRPMASAAVPNSGTAAPLTMTKESYYGGNVDQLALRAPAVAFHYEASQRPARPDPSATVLGPAAGAGTEELLPQGGPSAPTLAANDTGYFTHSTLAGTRLSTSLNDFATSVSVVSPESLAHARTTGSAITLGTSADKDRPVQHAAPAAPPSAQTEVLAQNEPVSTFSLNVSDVSFRLAAAALNRGEKPDPSSIRPEEFYNAFDYGDPAPAAGEPVACRIEQAGHPFLPQRNLVRIALKVPSTGRGAGQPLRLTVLLDTSGSMERDDRVATVRRAFDVLAGLLGPSDQVTLIGFARQPRMLAERIHGDHAKQLVDIASRTPAEGGTNLEEALKLAAQKAREQFDPAAQNRVVVLTDGAANLGNDNPDRLGDAVEALRQQGIAFDACGVGADGLDDSILEALTRKGDGRYYVIDTPEEADADFARKLAGAFHPAAENVKVQVRFNPARVQAYRLIGFEQHRLKTEDFRNDQVDAAELAGDEAGVALYEVEFKPDGEGELGDVAVRFRNADTHATLERSWTLAYQPQAPTFDRATPSLQLAGTAAFVAEKLRGGAPGAQIRLADFAPIVNRVRGEYANDATVQEFATLFGQARRLFSE